MEKRGRKYLQEQLFQGFGDEADSIKPGKTQFQKQVLEGEKGDEIKGTTKGDNNIQLAFDEVIQLPCYWSKPITGDLNSENSWESNQNEDVLETYSDDLDEADAKASKRDLEVNDENLCIETLEAYTKWNRQVVRNREVLTCYCNLLNLGDLMSLNDPSFPIDVTNIWGALVLSDLQNEKERKQSCFQFIKRHAKAVLEDDSKTPFVSVGLHELFFEVKCFVLNKSYSTTYSPVEHILIMRGKATQKGWTLPKIIYALVSITSILFVCINGVHADTQQVIQTTQTLLQ